MKYMIPFLCGLLSETNIPLLKCLFPPDQLKGTCHGFFEKVLKTFLHDEPDEEYSVDAVFLCQCLNELQSSEACLWFLERVDYSLDLSEEHLDPHQCCAVSYVISQSRDKPVHLNLENSVVSLSGLKTILRHSQNLRDLSMTLCQVWTAALKCEQQSYLINLLLLCGKEIYLPIITQKALHQQAGEIITQSADPVILHLCCGQNPQQLSDAFCRTISTWLPSISSVHFTTKQNQRESCEEWEKRVTLFKLNLCLQAALHQKENVQTTVKKVTLCGTDECNFLLDLYSHVKQYETETGRNVLPALLPVYQSTRAEWIIDLSERKAYLLLEVLKLQTEKKTVELSGWSDEESEVRSFLQCLPYISQLRLAGTKYIEFVVILFHEAAESERQTGQKTLELLTSMCIKSSFPYGDTNNHIQSAFLLDLYSHVKQYETETGRNVLPALRPVYQSVPAEWIIHLSERRTSLLLEVLKLQTVKKTVELRGWSDEESEVRSFLQCLPFISQLRFAGTKDIVLVVNLFRNAAESERRIRLKTLELLMSVCSLPYGHRNSYIQSDFLLDLYSNVKQYETETGRNLLPALRPVYQSVPAEWIIDLSETRTSLPLEVLKLQTVQKPVELRGWSDEESEVRSFLLCLPFISQLRFNPRFVGERHIKFMVNLFHQAAESDRQTGEKTLELLTSVCTYSSFPYGDTDSYIQSDFLLALYSHVKQYETETGRNVLPALLPVCQSVPAEWIIHLSERRTSLLLEVLKLQTVKKPVELRGWSDEESEVRSFLQCLPFISQLRFHLCDDDEIVEFLVNLFHQAAESERQTGEKTLELLTSVCTYSSFPYRDTDSYRQSAFLLDLYSHVKQYETETGRNVLPALRPVYQSVPAEWIIQLSERRTSLLLEVLKLQTVKKPVELWGWSDEESEVWSFLQCLPFISQLRFYLCGDDDDDDDEESVDFLVNLFHQAAESERQTGEKMLELLTSVCTYSSFPYGDTDSYRQSAFLLDLYSHVKQYETETGRNVLPALLPVYQSVPAEWIIHLSERRTSLLLEVLKLQRVKKPVELWGWSDEESEVRSFLQCLPFISQLRYAESLVPYLNELVVNLTRETELLTALLSAMDSTFTVNGVLSSKKCRAVGRALGLSPSRLNLTLKPRAISLRGAALLFRHITHLHKLCLNDRVLGRMTQAFRAETTCVPLVIQELSVVMTSVWSTQKLSKILSSLVALLNLWTVQCLNLIECKMEAHSLIGIMCHPETLIIRLSKETLQKFSFLVYEIKDKKLTCFFLEKVGGDLTSCSLSWEELLYFVQQGACCHVTVNTIKSKITSTHIKQLLPLLDKVHFKRLSSSIILSIIREIYETGSAHHVSSFLSSTENCINLNGRELDTIHWAALCFTLHNCTAISLSLLWTSIPEREIESILPLLNRVSHLSVDRLLLLKLLHCCSVSELQERAAAAVLSSLQNILDFSCRACLDLTTQTEDTTLHLTTEDCRVISTVIQKAQKHTELILEDCEIEDAGVDVLFSALCTVRLCCSKALLLQFLALVRVGTEFEHMTRAASLSQALDGKLDFSETQLDLQVCKSLALFLEYTDGLSELDLSYCQLSDHCLQLLLPHLHKIDMLYLSHNNISDNLARRITALFPQVAIYVQSGSSTTELQIKSLS
ncbi:hypothetical protein SRHO_G00011100 [Serrasalmus rhombeus]